MEERGIAATSPSRCTPAIIVHNPATARASFAPPTVERLGLAGVPLRQKIMIAMVAVVVLTSALMFLVVHSRTAALLDREIDAKGVRLVQLLASMGNRPWIEAMENVAPGAVPLKAAGIDLRKDGDILQVSVLALDAAGVPQASVQVDDRPTGLSGRSLRATKEGIEIHDGRLQQGEGGGARTVEARSFKLDLMRSGGGLRFYVILSLEHILAGRTQLRLIIVPAVLVAIIAGLIVAAWLSSRITKPVRLLMEDINTVSGGNLAHRTEARSRDEIGLLARTFDRMTTALRGARERDLTAKALEHELSLAREIQANLVPRKIVQIEGWDIGAFYRPSGEVGGDYFDILEIDERRIGLVVADVSGKGVPGSLVMAMARSIIRIEAERGINLSPAETLMRVNKLLAQDVKKGMFMTALYGVLDHAEGSLTAASAGHMPMVLWKAATGEVRAIAPRGIALGFDRGPIFNRTISEERVQIEPGDRLVLYTDGAIEMMNGATEEFGMDRFHARIRDMAGLDSPMFLERLVRALDDHKGAAPQHDDLTIVTLKRTPPAISF